MIGQIYVRASSDRYLMKSWCAKGEAGFASYCAMKSQRIFEINKTLGLAKSTQGRS